MFIKKDTATKFVNHKTGLKEEHLKSFCKLLTERFLCTVSTEKLAVEK